MIYKTHTQADGHQMVQVTFIIPGHIWADEPYLVGDFNGWNQSSHRLRYEYDSHWALTLDLEPSQHYQFRYLQAGEWLNDDHADGYIPNGQGSDNFVVST